MRWTDIPPSDSIDIEQLLRFMQRRNPGSTHQLVGVDEATISALASSLDGGVAALPPVYVDFLKAMGESMGLLANRGRSFSVTDLIADRQAREQEARLPANYFKISIGLEFEDSRQPDDFFDLDKPSIDGKDAATLRIAESELINNSQPPDRPFADFSDYLRTMAMVNFGIRQVSEGSDLSFSFGGAKATARVYRLLKHLGFEITELGASSEVIPMESAKRKAAAVLHGLSASGYFTATVLRLNSEDDKERATLKAIVADYRQSLMSKTS